MNAHDLTSLLTAVGAVIGAVGALVNATRMNGVRREVTNNHGSSLKDAVERIEKRQTGLIKSNEHLANEVKMLGHQLGELHQSANATHIDHAARLRALEHGKL